jgi:peptidoglycan/xylan/chitin deacetylase (PgdA/CDA1 family)
MNLALSHLNGIDVRRVWMRKFVAAGWELDSHSLTHPDLTALGSTALRHEVAGSRRRIRRIFGVPAHFFCYPAGRFNDRVIAAVRAAGYFGATTTVYGLAKPSSPYMLRRIRVNGSDSAADVLANIRNAS